MVSGHINRKKIMIVSLITIIVIVVVCLWLFTRDDNEVSFEANDTKFFRQIADIYEKDECKIHSLDAYYLSDTRTFYYNAKYTSYSPIDDTWYDVDEILYGSVGHFENSYCLSWDELYGFEEVDKEFKRAQKEGIHKTYTQEEIDNFLKNAYREKETDNE